MTVSTMNQDFLIVNFFQLKRVKQGVLTLSRQLSYHERPNQSNGQIQVKTLYWELMRSKQANTEVNTEYCETIYEKIANWRRRPSSARKKLDRFQLKPALKYNSNRHSILVKPERNFNTKWHQINTILNSLRLIKIQGFIFQSNRI